MKKLLTIIVCVFLYSVAYATGIQEVTLAPPIPTKSDMPQADSVIIHLDKKNVIARTVNEVFTNYSQKIDSLRKNYNQLSLMEYIDAYLKEETANIEARIANKVYVHKYAANEKLWIDTDYSEVAALIKVQTLDRIKTISEDVQNLSPGSYTMNDDKLRLLQKEVTAEIKE